MTEPNEELDPNPKPGDDDVDDAADLLNIVQTDASGKKVVGLDQLIEHRKANKQQKRRIAELEAQVEEGKGLKDRLDKVLPIADAVEKDPRLAKAIQDALDGTRRSAPTTEQVDDDPDLQAYAEIHGLITKNSAGDDVWDTARAKRALEIETRRTQKHMQPHIDAATDAAFGMRGEQNLAALYRMETPSGELVASDESIKEVLRESGIPMRQLADARVARTVGLMAAGLDREKGRTPKAPLEPIHFERGGGRRPGATVTLTDSEKRNAKILGLKEEELVAAHNAKPNRKGEIDLE